MTDDERQRHRALAVASAHVDLAVKNLSASIKQALNNPDTGVTGLRKTGNA